MPYTIDEYGNTVEVGAAPASRTTAQPTVAAPKSTASRVLGALGKGAQSYLYHAGTVLGLTPGYIEMGDWIQRAIRRRLGEDIQMPQPKGPLERLGSVSQVLGGLQVLPTLGAAGLENVFEDKPFDAINEWERLVYPDQFGEATTMAKVLGRLTERATRSKLAGQTAATVGFGLDVGLSLDTLAGHAASLTGSITRKVAAGAAPRAVARAVESLAKEGVVEGSASRELIADVGETIKQAILPRAIKGRRPAQGYWAEGIPAFEPSHLVDGMPLVVDEWTKTITPHVKRLFPNLDEAATTRVTDRILQSLQHEFSEGLRVRPIVGNWRRVGKAPDVPVRFRAAELDVAKGLSTADDLEKLVTANSLQSRAEAWQAIAQKYKDLQVRGVQRRITDTGREIEEQQQHIRRLGGEALDADAELAGAVETAKRDLELARGELAQSEARLSGLRGVMDRPGASEDFTREVQRLQAQITHREGVLEDALGRIQARATVAMTDLPEVAADMDLKDASSVLRKLQQVWRGSYRGAVEARLAEVAGGGQLQFADEEQRLKAVLAPGFGKSRGARKRDLGIGQWAEHTEDANELGLRRDIELAEIVGTGNEAATSQQATALKRWANKYGYGGERNARRLEKKVEQVQEWAHDKGLFDPEGTEFVSVYYREMRKPLIEDALTTSADELYEVGEASAALREAHNNLADIIMQRDEMAREMEQAMREDGATGEIIERAVKDFHATFADDVRQAESVVDEIERVMDDAGKTKTPVRKPTSRRVVADAQRLRKRIVAAHEALYGRTAEVDLDEYRAARQAVEETRESYRKAQEAAGAAQARAADQKTAMAREIERQALDVQEKHRLRLVAAREHQAAVEAKTLASAQEKLNIARAGAAAGKITDVEEALDAVRAVGIEVTPRLEGALRSRFLRILKSRKLGLERRLIEEDEFPLAEMVAEINTEISRRQAKPRVRTPLAGRLTQAKHYVTQGLRLSEPVRESLRNGERLALSKATSKEETVYRVFRELSLDPEEREVASTTVAILHPYFLKRQLVMADAGEYVPRTRPVDVADFIYKALKLPEPEGGIEAVLRTDGTVDLKKLAPSARRVWEAADRLAPAAHEWWVGDEQVIANELSRFVGGPELGDLGLGYMMQSMLDPISETEMRNILDGTAREWMPLMKNTMPVAEVVQAQDARWVDKLVRAAHTIDNDKEIRALYQAGRGEEAAALVAERVGDAQLPRTDLMHVMLAHIDRARRNEQLLNIYRTVEQHFPKVDDLSVEQQARYRRAGWTNLKWLDGQDFKGLEGHLVSPAFQAEVVRAMPEATGLNKLAKLLHLTLQPLKPAVLFTTGFMIAQVMEYGYQLAAAGVGTGPVLKGMGYAGRVVSRQALKALREAPETAVERFRWLTRTKEGLYQIVDALHPWASAKQADELVEELQRLPVNTGMGAAAREEVARGGRQWQRVINNVAKRSGYGWEKFNDLLQHAYDLVLGMDNVSRSALYVAYRAAGESPEGARKFVSKLAVEYGPEMRAPVDDVAGSLFWFWRYFRHRTEQFVTLGLSKPAAVAVAYETARQAPEIANLDSEQEDILRARPGFMRSDPSWQPFSFKFPGMGVFDWDRYPAVKAVDGPWVMYGRVRIPAWEWAGNVAQWATDPGGQFLRNTPPPSQALLNLSRGGSFIEGLPVVGGWARNWRKSQQLEDRPEFESYRPAPEDGILERARAPKSLWQRNPELAAAYEREKTELIQMMQKARRIGITVKPVFYYDCVKAATPDQLRDMQKWHEREGHGYVPLEGYTNEAGTQVPGILDKLEDRENGKGPMNRHDQRIRSRYTKAWEDGG